MGRRLCVQRPCGHGYKRRALWSDLDKKALEAGPSAARFCGQTYRWTQPFWADACAQRLCGWGRTTRRGFLGGRVQEQESRNEHGYDSEAAVGHPASQEQRNVIVYHLDYILFCAVQNSAGFLGSVIIIALSFRHNESVPGGYIDHFV